MIDMSAMDQTPSEALLIRTWTEPTMPHARRARLLTVNADQEPDTWSTAVGDAAIAQEVLRWLRAERGAPRGLRPPAPTEQSAPAVTPPLVDTDWAQAHLTHPDVLFIEVGVDDVGASVDRAGHLPGAQRIDWVTDLQHPTRRTFLEPAGFAALMDARGIHVDSHLVLLGDPLAGWAAAAYWLFTYHGHHRVSLLDGDPGLWLAERRPVADAAAQRPATSGYRPAATREEILLRRDQLLAGLVGAPPGTTLVDCRSMGEFTGRPARPYDVPTDRHRVPGHIPGAINLPVDDLVDPHTHRLLARPALRVLCRQRGLNPDDQIIVYCGVGERSALVWFVLHELLGWPDVRYYTGAWAEYGSLIDVPVDAGP